VRDYCEVKGEGRVIPSLCIDAFSLLEVDEIGLDWIDRKILEIIIDKFKGGPVGLNTIAAATGEEMGTIEEVYEPYLMQLGFLDRSPRGRIVTDIGYKHLGRKKPGQGKIIQ
jgi:Holliday junction DNA helicase RuvB